MHIPGFVTIYKDNDEFIHLYFFPGIINNHTEFNSIDLTELNIDYSYTKYEDNAIDYKFENKKITKIFCKLIKTKTNEQLFETLTL